ncbi:3006_t:CDS:2 [Entrophospora sp. SA101]|nr:3006_t:CDS:2 [Entrophospora sp. SA101]
MNNRNIAQVAVCNGCMNPKTRRFPPLLKKVPIEIKNVPMRHRRYLTPVHMNCSLGRAIGSNPYTNYRHLHGTIGITHNHRTLELYSGMVRAFLNVNEPLTWFHDTLTPASEWLKNNNPLLKKYASNVVISNPLPEDTVPIQFPLARQTIDSHEHTFNSYHSRLPDEMQRPPDLVIPNDSFLPEVHNEDANYNRLIAGSISYSDWNILNEEKTTTLPSNLRTAAPFFKKKQLQVNTMIGAYG